MTLSQTLGIIALTTFFSMAAAYTLVKSLIRWVRAREFDNEDQLEVELAMEE